MNSRAGLVLLTWSLIFGCVRSGVGQDYSQWGRSSKRNNSLYGMGIVTTWDVGKQDRKTGQFAGSKNIKWHTRLGSQTYGTPVVSGGRVFIGTNNGAGFLKGFPPHVDLGCLVCLRENDGKFLWQHSNAKLRTGRVHDWPMQGVCSTPLVEGDRLWYVSNRGEVVCLDTAGYFDGEDDGPIRAAVERVLHSNVELREGLNEGAASDELRSELNAAGFSLPTMTAVTTVEKDRRWRLEAEIDGRKRRFDVRVEDRNE